MLVLAVTLVFVVQALRRSDEPVPPYLRTTVEMLAGVAFLRWLYLARRNLDRIPGARARYRPDWTVIAWLVPLVNLVLPALVVADVARAGARGVARTRRTALVWAWWACFLPTELASGFLSARDSGTPVPTVAAVVAVAAAASCLGLLAVVTSDQAAGVPDSSGRAT